MYHVHPLPTTGNLAPHIVSIYSGGGKPFVCLSNPEDVAFAMRRDRPTSSLRILDLAPDDLPPAPFPFEHASHVLGSMAD